MKRQIGALLLALTVLTPLFSTTAHLVRPPTEAQETETVLQLPLPATDLYGLYAMRRRDVRREATAYMMGSVFAIGNAVGLLCGVQLAVGIAIST